MNGRSGLVAGLTSLGMVMAPAVMKFADSHTTNTSATTPVTEARDACIGAEKASVFKKPAPDDGTQASATLAPRTKIQVLASGRGWDRISYSRGTRPASGWIDASLVGDCQDSSDEAEGVETPLDDLDTFNGCSLRGDAKASDVGDLNELKNRWTAPTTSDFDKNVNIGAFLRRGDDSSRWDAHKGGDLVGYVHDVKVGGNETCNCHATDPDDRDTHIELVADPNDSGATNRVIVEVTPRWRALMSARGMDWTTNGLRAALLGRWVHVQGWLLFDKEHQNQSENTAPGNSSNWRGTAWEIHPITSLEVTKAPQ